MPSTLASPSVLDGLDLPSWYRRNRARSRALFELIADEAYYAQPIDLRHPIVFYEGHLPAFSYNTLIKQALGGRSIDPVLEQLFARGIDPDVPVPAAGRRGGWPDRHVVRAFADEADVRVLEALTHAELDVPGHPLLDRAEAVFTILEHEVMHHETLLYMWHRLPFAEKRRPHSYTPHTAGRVDPPAWVEIPEGRATLGVERGAIRFGWDNEFGPCAADVPAFAMQRHDVTNAEFLEFVDAGGYDDRRWWDEDAWAWIRADGVRHPLFWEHHGRWYWRGMFDRLPLPSAWPVYVTQAEASAYARWRGCRLPTEAEFQRAAYGSPAGDERHYPWGDATPSAEHGVFDLSSWDPHPIGSHPAGCSAWGVHDLCGNGWEWTSTLFGPFPGFRPMASYPQYSAEFFDGAHVVMKGASPATSVALMRPTFRNWFRPRYPYVYATFRCVRPLC